MKYTYLLMDDNGISNSENEIIIPVGTIFLHEFGLYKVLSHRDKDGVISKKKADITQIECERINK